jgi:hypothetical protein
MIARESYPDCVIGKTLTILISNTPLPNSLTRSEMFTSNLHHSKDPWVVSEPHMPRASNARAIAVRHNGGNELGQRFTDSTSDITVRLAVSLAASERVFPATVWSCDDGSANISAFMTCFVACASFTLCFTPHRIDHSILLHQISFDARRVYTC